MAELYWIELGRHARACVEEDRIFAIAYWQAADAGEDVETADQLEPGEPVISAELADRLRALGTPDTVNVFASGVGTWLDPDNPSERVLAPACAEAGVEWAGFHTFRHTVASRLVARGRNAVQVQRWLGHHSPAFTLATYVHLLEGDLGEPSMSKPSRVRTMCKQTPDHSTPQ
jgi:Phage integrase family